MTKWQRPLYLLQAGAVLDRRVARKGQGSVDQLGQGLDAALPQRSIVVACHLNKVRGNGGPVDHDAAKVGKAHLDEKGENERVTGHEQRTQGGFEREKATATTSRSLSTGNMCAMLRKMVWFTLCAADT